MAYRGQSMTNAALDELSKLLIARIPVTPTHFFSCDARRAIANKFAKGTLEGYLVPVVFEIKGFSDTRLRGMCDAIEETESLFSTQATFKILSIKDDLEQDRTIVRMHEVTKKLNSVPLPY